MKIIGWRLALALAFGVFLGGCETGPGESQESREAFKARMLEIEKRMKDSMPKTQENALKQNVNGETLNRVQQQLATLKEYQGEPTPKMDFVTVNAIQAFQRQMRLDENGLLDEKTLRLLEQEAKKVEAGDTGYFQKGYYAGARG